MKATTALIASLTSLALAGIALPVKADTVNARCDFYPIGEDSVSASMPCTFSQHQGHIRIETENGAIYLKCRERTPATVVITWPRDESRQTKKHE